MSLAANSSSAAMAAPAGTAPREFDTNSLRILKQAALIWKGALKPAELA